MSNELKILYEKIRNGKVSYEDGAKEIEKILANNNDNETISETLLKERTIEYLKELLAYTIKSSKELIEEEEDFGKYGIDSVMMLQMTDELEKVFGELSKTLFFEYKSIIDLSEYFINNFKNKLVTIFCESETNSINELHNNSENNENLELENESIENNEISSHALIEDTHNKCEDIAIIGLAGKYPKARNCEEFWENLKSGIDCVTEIPWERWDYNKYYDEEKQKVGKTYCKWGGFLDGVYEFDPNFFNITPVDAEIMDPQERLFLECVYETIEDAGYTKKTLAGNKDCKNDIGVFVGVMYEEYQLYGVQEQIPIALPGSSSSIANRVSYFFNFNGPSMSINTMCSSSLTAIHLACQSIRLGECSHAIAGGVNVSVHPNKFLLLGQGKFASSKGRCESFGDGGDGYVPGEGVGAVLLKGLNDAIRDGDNIYGVIKGCAINHGGKVNGYTVPNPTAQSEVIRKAIKDSGINPKTINYIEAHGTGTSLGDPIEISGLLKVFNEFSDNEACCSIGSVKSNIGHCESAAGIAGLTKILLQLKYGKLVPSLHSIKLNKNINFNNIPFYVQQDYSQWNSPVVNLNEYSIKEPRRAGLSCFGAGGSNAHLVIEEYIKESDEDLKNNALIKPKIIILSAKNKERLYESINRLLNHLEEKNYIDKDLLNIAYTLQVGREAMNARIAVIVNSIEELKNKLKEFINNKIVSSNVYYKDKVMPKSLKELNEAKNDIDTLIRGEYFVEIIELWLNGIEIDWSKLYKEYKPKKISLPTYPFEEKKYFYPKNNSITNYELENDRLSRNESLKITSEHLIHMYEWEEKNNTWNENIDESNTVLLIYNKSNYEFKNTIYEHYEKTKKVILVELSNETRRISEDMWTCDVHDANGFEICLGEYSSIDTIYFLTEFGECNDYKFDLAEISKKCGYNEVQLLRLIKVIKAKCTPYDSVNLYIITQDNYRIDDIYIYPNSGGITGLAYSIAQGEHNYLVRNIDISAEDLENETTKNNLLKLIINEEPSDRGELVKIKLGKRYRRIFKSIKNNSNTVTFKKDGVYIITGGSGTIGNIITSNLMDKYNANVIWIGRKAEESEEIQSKMRELRKKKGSLNYIQADVTNLEELNKGICKIKNKYNKIDGAIFSSVVFNFENPVVESSEKEFLEIFDVKARGGLNLYSALKDEKLDFMCYFSSAQAFSFSGAANLSAYASGITFADSFVNYIRKESKFPIGIINWGFWNSSIKEIDLSNKTASLKDEEGFECFEQCMSLIHKNVINQIICMKVSENIKSILRYDETKSMIIYPETQDSIIGKLLKDYEDKNYKLETILNKIDFQQIEKNITNMLYIKLFGSLLENKYDNITVINLCKKIGILDKFKPWLMECLDILDKGGHIKLNSDNIQVYKTYNEDEIEYAFNCWKNIVAFYKNEETVKAQIGLVDICLNNTLDIITGKVLATDVIFPNSSMDKVEEVYKNNEIADYFNNSLAELIYVYIKERIKEDTNAKIKLIEIGAGTGGASNAIFNKIRPYERHIEYTYTDISKSFLDFAREKYGTNNSFLRYKIWNVEKAIEENNIIEDNYDIIIASNVLHATKNVNKTLSNIKGAIKRNGIILLNEVTSKNITTTLTFGLLDGWWLFEDEEIRIKGSPLLEYKSWSTILKNQGFINSAASAKILHGASQHIIIAESNGVVQKDIVSKSSTRNEKINNCEINLKNDDINEQIETIELNNNEMEDNIIKVVTQKLSEAIKINIEDVDINRAFSDYGIDSINSTTFVNLINKELRINLNTAIIFDYSTVKKLSGYIVNKVNKRNSKKLAQNENSKVNKNSIAVVGMSGQFPDALNIDELWTNLVNGHYAVHELPDKYLNRNKYYNKVKQYGKTYCKWGGILKERDCFDPLFFNISPKDAKSMNMEQRLILEASWKAIEDAGYNPKNFDGKNVGVFIGAEPSNYYHDSFIGSSDAIIASRLSYYLNLTGPAVVINTGCSSSAVAIDFACKSLISGESSLALAGGVFANLNDRTLVALSDIEMLSKKGKCLVFDEEADGTIMSEAVGIVVLKRLDEAIEERDHIYGVIECSGINQDGASNGITAPNGLAQEKLITSLYDKFKINPEDINYFEAHGTGTKLGDPVEANALIRAFEEYTFKKNFCNIGSIKSYIGHTGAASGVIGLMKILLSLKYKYLPGVINYKKLNSLINIKESPFNINTNGSVWSSKNDKPLMAALNSFGHSGTNAHIVVKEHRNNIVQENEKNTKSDIFIIPISAKNEKRLEAYIVKMSKFFKKILEDGMEENHDLKDIAYTLQIGREAMQERVAFLVSDIKDITFKMEQYLNNNKQINNCWREKSKRTHLQGINEINNSENFTTEDLKTIAEQWSKGAAIDWNLLYSEQKPRRVSLPTYPFSNEVYVIDKAENEKAKENINLQICNSLIHKNTSNINGIKFSSIFNGEEFFLTNHVVKGEKILPAVAYLEMAREAIEIVTEPIREENTMIVLKNIIWASPIVVGEEAVKVDTEILIKDNNKISYKIHNNSMNLHNQGSAVLNKVSKLNPLNINSIKSDCSKRVISSKECYGLFSKLGVEYGTMFQGILELYVGKEVVLAKLELHPSLENTLEQYVIHPSLVDSALQAAVGLLENYENIKPLLPFSVEEVSIINRCSSNMWAVVRYSENNNLNGEILTLDIDLCDELGNICLMIKGLESRNLEGFNDLEVDKNSKSVILNNYWKEVETIDAKHKAAYDYQYVIFSEFDESLYNKLKNIMPDAILMNLQSEEISIEKRFKKYILSMLKELQQILKEHFKDSILIQLVVENSEDKKYFKALLAMLKSVRMENPRVFIQLIELEEIYDVNQIKCKIEENKLDTINSHIKYNNDGRFINVWKINESKISNIKIPWVENGVYVIAGGAGGIGLILLKEIARKVANAVVILVGRSKLDTKIEKLINSIRSNKFKVEYRQADISNYEEVKKLIEGIKIEFGTINGIINSAGVIRDNYIVNKTEDEVISVISPKVNGIVNLDLASKDIKLDFFINFSSCSAITGNLGQADYATANSFTDEYSKYRNKLVKLNHRCGQTFSINWPLWKHGGMIVNKEIEKMIGQQTGMKAMSTSDGIDLLYKAFNLGQEQIVMVSGDINKIIEKKLFDNLTLEYDKGSDHIVDVHLEIEQDTSNMIKIINDYLVKSVAKITEVKTTEIDKDADLKEYGFDSITFTKLSNEINSKFNIELIPTIFFQYATINNIGQYLMEEYKDLFSNQLSFDNKAKISNDFQTKKFIKDSYINNEVINDIAKTNLKENLNLEKVNTKENDKIAIIGMSGAFPGAKDLEKFWNNIMMGRNSITEIPKERWDWKEYYGDPRKEVNKTNVKWAGVIDGVDEFDPLFFGISPKEAELMDPQQRILLMHVWKAIEDAGYSPKSLAGTNTSVFIGTGFSGYSGIMAKSNLGIEAYSSIGVASSIATNRISYFLDIHGPSEPIDTACSSSLVAIHRAVTAIESGSCEMAIVGGINTILTPELHISFNKANMLAEDGLCKVFSEKADGYVRGEGVGIIILKKLKNAELSGDNIYGVIRGISVNHGGKANSLTAPNPEAQADLIISTYNKSNIDPQTVGYIEAHGTGTKLGDPIEIEALKNAFKELVKNGENNKYEYNYCGIGSVKSNIGHLELAAGIAGVIKVLLQIKHKTIVKTLHCDKVNPYIKLENSPFYIVQENREWIRKQDKYGMNIPRRAGVSSFGFGGVNSHIIIEEYIPSEEKDNILNDEQIILLSSKNENSLKEMTNNLLKEIKDGNITDENLRNVAYTLQVGRDAMEERLAIKIKYVKRLEECLTRYLENEELLDNVFRGTIISRKNDLSIFSEDEDLKNIINSWISKKKYNEILSLWVKGVDFDWNRIYLNNKPKRMSLPTYSFSKEKYWVTNMISNSKSYSIVNEVKKNTQEHSSKVIMTKTWSPKNIENIVEENDGVVLLLGTDKINSLTSEISNNIETEVITIYHGENNFSEDIATDFYSEIEGERLYKKIQERLNNKRIIAVIDVTAYDEVYEESVKVELGKIKFLQKLIEDKRSHEFKLIQVTYKLQYLKLEKTTMQGARLAGLYSMLGSEYKVIKSITMDSDCSIKDTKNIVKQIKNELFNVNLETTQCCYREDNRFEVNLAEELIDIPQNGIRGKEYTKDDVILITGGSRGIGADIAEHIISNGVKNLVIVAKQKLPKQEEWKNVLLEDYDEQYKEKIRKLQSFIDRGVNVKYYNTNLTEVTSLKEMIKEINESMGKITGVFHCAGLSSKNPAFYKKSLSEFNEVCTPKMEGLVMLHRELEHQALQFFLVFSSISSISPVMASGQSDYATANSYMDYYTINQVSSGKTYFKSILWPAWNNTGMSKRQVVSPVYEKTGILLHESKEGMNLLDFIQNSNYAVSIPCIINKDKFIGRSLLEINNNAISNFNIYNKTRESLVRCESGMDIKEAVVAWLEKMFIAELKLDVDNLDKNKPFSEYGVDSIMILQLVENIQNEIGEKLEQSIMLEYSTIGELTEFLLSNYNSKLSNKFLCEINEVDNTVSENVDGTLSEINVNKAEAIKIISKENESLNCSQWDDIAVVGISSNFPGASTKERYFEMLKDGICAIKQLPDNRWHNRKDSNDYGGWLDDINYFDNKFFNIDDKDAVAMDPQARIILEESLKSIYDSGYEAKELWEKNVGVYIGARLNPSIKTKNISEATNPILGIGQNYFATNISRFFNFHGPSMVVDTACSSGITGILLAADALRNKRIEMALVGAVSILESSFAHDIFSKRNILSKSGEFHIFDKRANGEVLGEGSGVVVLKTLKDAIADGNKIYAVIKGIATNNDGRTIGPGSPNIHEQKQVMKNALRISGKKPEDISYIEVNGGGTTVIDSVELKVLTDVYKLKDLELGKCYLGCVKPNIGHLLLASGIAGFIRCVLSVYNKQIPPFISAKEKCDYYDFLKSRIIFNRNTLEWTSENDKKFVVAQNSFPDGGTNYSVIIEEFIPDKFYKRKIFSKEIPNMTRTDMSLFENHDQTNEKNNKFKNEVSEENLVFNTVWGRVNEEGV